MRKIFILSLCGLVFCPAFSQVKMGIKGAPQLTWASTDSKSVGTGSPHINISYGLVLDYFINENYSFGTELSIGTYTGNIRPGLVYVNYNPLASFNPAVTNMEYTYKLQYINVPFLIKMRTKEIGYFRYYAEFGLGMSYNFKAKADVSSSAIDRSDVDVNDPDPVDRFSLKNSSLVDMSQKVNFFRSSIIIGAGIQYNVFGNTMLVSGLRYDNALNDFTDESTWKTRMNFIALHLGVMF